MSIALDTRPQTSTAARLAETQLTAYNARDLDAFCACFSDDVEVFDYPGKLTLKGMTVFRARYAERFKAQGLVAKLLSRIVLGACAIDHERIWFRGPELSEPVEAVAIYTVDAERIARVEFIREEVPQ